MKLLHTDKKNNIFKVQVTEPEDLWYLRSLIETGDSIKGTTFRKIKLSGESERTKIALKRIVCQIQVEKKEYSEGSLRLLGPMIEGPEDIPKGSYHTFALEIDSTITIQKRNFLTYHQQIINEACQDKVEPILIVVCDREDALFARLKKYGYQILTQFSGDVEKKEERSRTTGNFYDEVAKKIEYYTERENIASIIVASPAFFAGEVAKHITNQLTKKRITIATCNSVSRQAIKEVLTRPEIKHVLVRDRSAREETALEELLVLIKKNSAAVYGKKQTLEAAEAGAIKKLLITDSWIHALQENKQFSMIENMMRQTEKSKGELMILSSENDAGKQLDGLGGVGAILHYKLALE